MSAKLALLTTCKQWREAGFHQAIVDSITQVDNYRRKFLSSFAKLFLCNFLDFAKTETTINLLGNNSFFLLYQVLISKILF